MSQSTEKQQNDMRTQWRLRPAWSSIQSEQNVRYALTMGSQGPKLLHANIVEFIWSAIGPHVIILVFRAMAHILQLLSILCPQLHWFGPLICGISMKNKRTRFFFCFFFFFVFFFFLLFVFFFFCFFSSDFSLQSYAPFRRFFFYFAIISLWNLINKISGEALGLGSWYLVHGLWLRCRWPN